jgi:precorrin-2 dehydrogenase/sirohydrochlorin ferrochelatase
MKTKLQNEPVHFFDPPDQFFELLVVFLLLYETIKPRRRWTPGHTIAMTNLPTQTMPGEPPLFPIFLNLAQRRCLVVGAGKVGEAKIASLLETGAHIRVVALTASLAVREWSRAGKIDLELRAFAPDDLDGAFLVIVATNSRNLNERVYEEARRRNVLCNVVDVPDLCDFYYPAVVQRGDLQIAISTNGQSPSLAQRIRQQLEKQFGPGYAAWVAELGATRRLILASDLDRERKLELLHSLASREAVNNALAELPELAAKGDRA